MSSPVSVYVHFPWCLQKCPYCDFASSALRRDKIPHDVYADAVLRELDSRAEQVRGRALASVFFGGGTPSLWDASAIGRVLRRARGLFAAVPDDLEVTVECNPTSIDGERAAALAAVGVNRLSIGVQSLDDGRLLRLGRLHSARGALVAVRAAMTAELRVSADLIFGVDGQSAAEAVDETRSLLDLGIGHLSAYALTLEPGTKFGELARRGRRLTVSDDTFADSYEAIERACAAYGLEHYEISNYARAGERSRHNLHYWRGGEYLGVGAGAVGRVNDARWRNDADAARYVERPDDPAVWTEQLSPSDRVREGLMLGLRTVEGVSLPSLGRDAGIDVARGREPALRRSLSRGDIVADDGGRSIRIPRDRWLRADDIVASLF
ncbi:MAG: radical SAM family heme chaperone HemW [Deltaproteobacteria bacterium]|nr:radical SAM family heme chaperone HemW [Deltaproteobacteria bacterium]